jgi:TrwC relaxase
VVLDLGSGGGVDCFLALHVPDVCCLIVPERILGNISGMVSDSLKSATNKDQIQITRYVFRVCASSSHELFTDLRRNDSRVALEMSASIKEELKWFERFACCRDRRGELYNSEAARKTGKMLAATFVHETSRAKDPSLHMHVLIANVTIDQERNEALAMSYGEMFEMRKTLDARIHNNLARRLSVLGYTVEVAEHGFRLRDIPAPIEEIYSVRNREIATAKELLREGYTVQQLGDAVRDRPVKEKSELWVSGRIRELLGDPKLPSDRSIARPTKLRVG